MSIKTDIKTTVRNSVGLVGSVASAGTGVVCEVSNLVIPMVGGVVPFLKEVAKIHKRVVSSYDTQHNGTPQAEADARAAAIFDKSAAQVLEAASRFTGKALAIAEKELEEA